MLTKYISRTATLLSDLGNQFWSQASLINFINEARGQVAAEGQCVKVVPPGTNSIASISVLTGGNYGGTPTVTITGPGTGATAHAVMAGSAVSTIVVDTPGTTKYDNTTTVTFSGGSPVVAATASAVISCLNTVANQEVYTFAAADVLAALTSGVASILFVESIAVSWGALKPVLDQWNWNDLQAKVRAYPITSGQPAMWAQLGQGVNGSVYLQPVPTQALPMEWNCVCIPIDLATDSDPEAIPYPWTDAVPYYAAYLAFLNARRPEEAADKMKIFNFVMGRARAQSESSFIPSYYA